MLANTSIIYYFYFYTYRKVIEMLIALSNYRALRLESVLLLTCTKMSQNKLFFQKLKMKKNLKFMFVK